MILQPLKRSCVPSIWCLALPIGLGLLVFLTGRAAELAICSSVAIALGATCFCPAGEDGNPCESEGGKDEVVPVEELLTDDEEPDQPAAFGMSDKVATLFAESKREDIPALPLFGEAGFPPQLVRGDLEESVAQEFYPALDSPMYQYDPLLHLRPTPNFQMDIPFGELPSGELEVRINSLGLCHEAEPSSTGVDLRILVTGASNIQGLCASDETAVHHLETALSEKRPGQSVEVLNAGCGTYNFYNFLAVLERHADLDPDVFVVGVYSGNDFFGGVKLWRYFSGMGAALGGPFLPHPMLDQGRGMQLLGLELGQVIHTLNNPEDENLMLCCACSITAEIDRICKERDIGLVFACIPGPMTGQPHAMAEERADAESRLGLPADAINVSDRIVDRWLAFVASRGSVACDIRPEIRKANVPLYFPRDGHLNLDGQELVARTILPYVETALSKAASPPPPNS